DDLRPRRGLARPGAGNGARPHGPLRLGQVDIAPRPRRDGRRRRGADRGRPIRRHGSRPTRASRVPPPDRLRLPALPPPAGADEPTGNLDSETAAGIVQLLLDVRAERGMTVIVATHNPQVAARCDRVARLHDGRLLDDVEVPRNVAPEEMLARISRLGP